LVVFYTTTDSAAAAAAAAFLHLFLMLQVPLGWLVREVKMKVREREEKR